MDKKINLADFERENERLRRQLAELDEMPRKKGAAAVSDLRGVQDMTTSVSKGIRSMPGQEDRYYLDLYLLQKERERLVKETRWIKKRRLRVGRKIADRDKERAEKEEKVLEGMSILQESLPGRPSQPEDKEEAQSDKHEGEKWKRIALDY